MEQLRVGGDEAELLVARAQLDRADHLVAVLEPDHVPLVPAEDLGVDPLHHALAGAEREAGAVGPERAEREDPLAALERADQVERQRRPARCGSLAVRGSAGRSRTLEAYDAPARGQGTDLAAGGRARPPRRPRRGWRGRPPSAAGSSSLDVAGQQAGRGRGRRSTGRRRPRAGVAAAVTVTPADSSSTVRRGVPKVFATSASSSETTFRSSCSSPRIASRSSMVRSSSSFSLSSSSLENLVSRRSGMSRM